MKMTKKICAVALTLVVMFGVTNLTGLRFGKGGVITTQGTIDPPNE